MGHLRRRRSHKTAAWDLTPLFSRDDDPRIERELKEVEEKNRVFIGRWKGRSDYLSEPAVLRQALDDYERLKKDCGSDGDAGYYFWLRTQQDQIDPLLKARAGKTEELGRKIENEMQFFHLNVAKIPAAEQRKFVDHPLLGDYRHFLERLFAESRHLLSEPEERILNLKSSTSSANWTKMTFGFLAREERDVALEDGARGRKSLAEIVSLMNSSSRKVRDSAARAFNHIVERHADVAEAEINSVLANKKVDDELRGMERPDLARHIGDDIDSSTVDSLISAVSDRNGISRRYYGLKARLMGLRRLKYHERNVECGDIRGEFSYPASCRLILKVFSGLDPKFAEIFEGFIRRGLIDVYPRKGKAGGAFCAHHLISQPTYILLNHTDRLHDVLTLAHELGHGINNELIREKQNALNFGTPTSTAEVASTFMEDFVLREIMKRADDETRLWIMMTRLNDDISSIFRQVACYRFEGELHSEFRKKGYLSKEEIGRLFQGHMAAYMGDFVEQSKGSDLWWVYWSHIRYFFYVYSYASGLLISKALQSSVKRDPAFIENVKSFLAAGLSESPKSIFHRLGVDISDRSFWDRGLDEIEGLLDETAALARRLKKL